MSDYSFFSSPSPSEATLAFEPLHEGQDYSKAVLETLGVTAILSPEEVMKRYKDGSAQAENAKEWAEVKGVCVVIEDPATKAGELGLPYSHLNRRIARVVSPGSEALSKPLVFKNGNYSQSILLDSLYASHWPSLPVSTRLYGKRLFLSPATKTIAATGEMEDCWIIENAILQGAGNLMKQSADHLMKSPSLHDLP